MNEEEIQKAFSVVLINKELEELEQDVFHMNVQMEELEKAVEAGADFIGIFSEYGGGKTSIVKNFAKASEYRICNICLWNYEGEVKNDSNGRMTSFTHSFLYQFSRIVEPKWHPGFTRNINRMMSRNYKQLSFSTDMSLIKYCIVIFLMFCYTVIVPIYKVFFTGKLPQIEKCLMAIWNMKQGIAVIAAICLLIFFLDNNVIFSWKDNDARQDLSDSDIYEIFEKIVRTIVKDISYRKKYIVNIEDLDRVSDKGEVREFLKALYKFNSLLRDNDRKRFVFVVSLSMKSYFEMQNENLCEKLFDYTLVLRPMNRERAADLFMNLLKEKRADISSNLKSSSMEWKRWLIKGDNLGIRTIKSRLNVAMAIYDDLCMEIKEETNYIEDLEKNILETVDFEKCVIVAYLESTYPMDMYHFTMDSSVWKTVIADITNIENDTRLKETEKEQKINEILNGYKENSWNFRQEIKNLFSTSFRSVDYWQYFYRIPKRHHEKKTDS